MTSKLPPLRPHCFKHPAGTTRAQESPFWTPQLCSLSEPHLLWLDTRSHPFRCRLLWRDVILCEWNVADDVQSLLLRRFLFQGIIAPFIFFFRSPRACTRRRGCPTFIGVAVVRNRKTSALLLCWVDCVVFPFSFCRGFLSP